MKNFITFFAVILTFMSCRAQVAPLYNADMDLPDGTYYKDIDNDLNKFEGTWKWQSSNNSLTITLDKKENIADYNSFTDDLAGEYKYVENGVELVNTLPLLSDSTIEPGNRAISSCQLVSFRHHPKCDDCSQNERRVSLSFIDNERKYLRNTLVLRYKITSSGEEQLHAEYYLSNAYTPPNEDSPGQTRVPYGSYVFIKQ